MCPRYRDPEIPNDPNADFKVLKGKAPKRRKLVNPAAGVTMTDVQGLSGDEVIVDPEETARRKQQDTIRKAQEEADRIEAGWEVRPLPEGVDKKKIGEPHPKKGEVDGAEFWSWDSVQECNPDDCPIRSRCKDSQKALVKCKLQEDYIKYVTRTVSTQMKLIPATDRMKIGFHLLPLYGQLVMFKMVAAAARPIIFDDKGMPKAHPVFKEIRSIISTINQVWGTVDIDPGTKRVMKKQMDGTQEFVEEVASYEDVCGDS